MKKILRNIFITLIMFALLAVVLCGCTNAEEQEQTESRTYSVGDVTELGTVIAVGHDKYALLESTNAEGQQMWILESGDFRSTSTFLTCSVKFITFTDDFYVYMQAISTSPGKLYFGTHKLDPVSYDRTGIITRTIPADEFTTFPIIERVRYEENEVWMELRYHVSENELSEDTVIYHFELISGRFEEVDSFEKTMN